MLHLHRSERADRLADALSTLCTRALPDPFAQELVAVPTRGMERWLTQRLSLVLGASQGRADGICAGVAFPSPYALVSEAVAVASGVDPELDPWLPERSVWPLLEVVEECIGEPWLATLASYLGRAGSGPDPVRNSRRLSAVRHLARLFDRYALHRPAMLRAWADGLELDEDGVALAPTDAWQAELWRRLRARIALAGPAERRGSACARLLEDPALVDLPDRISLFGLTRLPAGHLQVLRALAGGRDVHLFLLHPSAALWGRVADQLAVQSPVLVRASDRTAGLPANQLLASWGRDARELQLLLSAGDQPLHDDHHGTPTGPVTLLGRLQDAVRADRAPPGPPLPGQRDRRPLLEDSDRSVAVHSCHGRARQVEVVRDAILHALAQDETLEPRDVIVMCPDIENFAPLIQATFGVSETAARLDGDDTDLAPPGDPTAAHAPRPTDLRVRLADRSLRQTNPVLAVVSQLLELSQQRLTASQVLDLADRGPVRRRFSLHDDDLTRLQDWIAEAGIRWGLDAQRRAPFKLERIDSGTWQTGLRRLLLGVTMTEDGQRLFEDVLPLDDVDSRAIELAGRFAELVARLGLALEALATSQPIDSWAHEIAQAADALTATSPADAWQRAELTRLLDDIVSEADGRDEPLAPVEARAHIFERLQGRPTRANFRTGHLTVCTLMPMRSVPHRVVCLLGLDDGAFPRKAPRDGDDLMLAQPRIGERDPRSEDRQLLLDALLAATERLIVTYTGNDERTNTPRPPAVPVGELLDAIDATVRLDSGAAPRSRVLIRHPLQPFDPRNFDSGELLDGEPWSFDDVTLAGARALTAPRLAPEPFLAQALAPRDGRVVELADLVRFVEHPVRAFLRQRLGISLGAASDEVRDALAIELDNLERWGVGQRLLDALLDGVDGNTAIKAEIRRGTLPPGVLGEPVIIDVYPLAQSIAAAARAVAPPLRDPEPLDVRVALDEGRLLTGTVTGVSGDVLLNTTFSRVAAKHRLAAWVRLLAVTATHPERELSAATVGRAGGRDVRTALLAPLATEPEARHALAVAQLAMLVDLYDRGMREPLPIFCKTSAAFAEAARAGQDPAAAALREWQTGYQFDLEDREPEHVLAFGGVRTLSELLELRPAPDEEGDGWSDAEPSRLGRLALRLWGGLLDREQVSAR